MWLTPPLMKSEITDFARGLKCGGFGASGESTFPPGFATHSAPSNLSWLSKSRRARPPIPMPASIQNLRREMYCSLRFRSLSFSNMAILLLDINEFVQIQRYVSQIVQRRARRAIAAGILSGRGIRLFLQELEVLTHFARVRITAQC